MADLSLTAANLCDRIEAYTGVTDAGHALAYLNDGYRWLLSGKPHPQDPLHPWSFLTPLAQLDIGGSVDATTASGTVGGVVTVADPAAGIFDPSMVGQIMTISDTTERTAQITDYTSATVVTTSDTTGFTTKAVSVGSTGIYDAPSDFGGLVTGFTYGYNTGTYQPALVEVNPERILAMWRDSNLLDDAYYWALAPATFVKGTGQRWKFVFAPLPDEALVLRYRYRIQADALADDSNYPLGGPDIVDALLACALAKAEERLGKLTNGPLYEAAVLAFEAAIAADSAYYRRGGHALSIEEGW